MDALFNDPSFWVALSLVIFIALVWKPAKRIVLGGLDDRADKIRAELDEAAKLREEAQELLAAYKRKQRDAERETEEIMSQARTEAQHMREQATKDLEALLERREQQAVDRIARAEEQAVAEVRGLAVDLAIAATRKLLADEIDDGKAAALIDDSIGQLDDKFN